MTMSDARTNAMQSAHRAVETSQDANVIALQQLKRKLSLKEKIAQVAVNRTNDFEDDVAQLQKATLAGEDRLKVWQRFLSGTRALVLRAKAHHDETMLKVTEDKEEAEHDLRETTSKVEALAKKFIDDAEADLVKLDKQHEKLIAAAKIKVLMDIEAESKMQKEVNEKEAALERQMAEGKEEVRKLNQRIIVAKEALARETTKAEGKKKGALGEINRLSMVKNNLHEKAQSVKSGYSCFAKCKQTGVSSNAPFKAIPTTKDL